MMFVKFVAPVCFLALCYLPFTQAAVSEESSLLLAATTTPELLSPPHRRRTQLATPAETKHVTSEPLQLCFNGIYEPTTLQRHTVWRVINDYLKLKLAPSLPGGLSPKTVDTRYNLLSIEHYGTSKKPAVDVEACYQVKVDVDLQVSGFDQEVQEFSSTALSTAVQELLQNQRLDPLKNDLMQHGVHLTSLSVNDATEKAKNEADTYAESRAGMYETYHEEDRGYHEPRDDDNGGGTYDSVDASYPLDEPYNGAPDYFEFPHDPSFNGVGKGKKGGKGKRKGKRSKGGGKKGSGAGYMKGATKEPTGGAYSNKKEPSYGYQDGGYGDDEYGDDEYGYDGYGDDGGYGDGGFYDGGHYNGGGKKSPDMTGSGYGGYPVGNDYNGGYSPNGKRRDKKSHSSNPRCKFLMCSPPAEISLRVCAYVSILLHSQT